MQYVSNARRRIRSGLLGGHITRRMGQSLEFREHRPYTPGDDIRRIDWRISGGRLASVANPFERLLVRKFEAEERMNMLISIDTRSTMMFPQVNSRVKRLHISKLQAARWLAESVGFLAGEKRDTVTIHRLFGTESAQVFRGSSLLDQMQRSLPSLLASYEGEESVGALNLGDIDRHLPPASIWIILSDYYFDPATVLHLVERIHMARDRMRWVIPIDLNSWPYERAQLGNGSRLITGPFSGDKKVSVSDTVLDEIAAKIIANKSSLTGEVMSTWNWDTVIKQDDLRPWFETQLRDDRTLELLYMRDV